VDVFDAVLVSKAQPDLLVSSRTIFSSSTNPVKALGPPSTAAVYSPFSFKQTIEFILCLPINFIPFVGVPIFLIITGRRAGPLQHHRYFKLRGLTKKERNQEVRARRWAYTWFGTMALMLQLIPVLSMFFLLTTAAGSALWVADIENEKRKRATEVDQQVGGLQRDEEFPPDYTDTDEPV
jgi:hypothetical protein